MKKITHILILSFCCVAPLFSQLDFGIIGGLSTMNVKQKEQILSGSTSADSIRFIFADANDGFHFGGLMRYRKGNYVIQPELIFNSNKVSYKLLKNKVVSQIDSIQKERFFNLDIPVMLGIKISVLRLMAGPVGHIHISSNSELTDVNGFDEKFKTMTFGYQLGLGFDVGSLMLDLRHEGNFTEFADHISYFGDQVKYGSRPTRLIFSLSYKF